MTKTTARRKPKRPRTGRSPSADIRVLIADDHGVVLEGLSAIISRQADMTVVAAANDGQECLAAWERHRPDVVLLDLRMPKLDGVEVLAAIRAQDPAARVIVLTTFDTDEDIYRAIKSGARAYLLKDARREELLDTVRRVHAGETCIAPDLAAKLAGCLGSQMLTERERQVLQLLARGQSNKEIGATLEVGETTIKSHLKSIFAKLDVTSRTEAIAEALQRGLVRL